MKKIAFMTILLLSFVSVAFAKISDNQISVGGIYLEQDISKVNAIYGKPKVNTYNNYAVYGYLKDGCAIDVGCVNNKVVSIYVTSFLGYYREDNKKIATCDGIAIGSTEDELLKIYGNPDDIFYPQNQNDGPVTLSYYSSGTKNMVLQFEMGNNQKVTGITVSSYKQ